jgi:hypothetical protein
MYQHSQIINLAMEFLNRNLEMIEVLALIKRQGKTATPMAARLI